MFGAAFMRASCALWAAPFNASCVMFGAALGGTIAGYIHNRKKLL